MKKKIKEVRAKKRECRGSALKVYVHSGKHLAAISLLLSSMYYIKLIERYI
jgi:hypothetical protein